MRSRVAVSPPVRREKSRALVSPNSAGRDHRCGRDAGRQRGYSNVSSAKYRWASAFQQELEELLGAASALSDRSIHRRSTGDDEDAAGVADGELVVETAVVRILFQRSEVVVVVHESSGHLSPAHGGDNAAVVRVTLCVCTAMPASQSAGCQRRRSGPACCSRNPGRTRCRERYQCGRAIRGSVRSRTVVAGRSAAATMSGLYTSDALAAGHADPLAVWVPHGAGHQTQNRVRQCLQGGPPRRGSQWRPGSER